MIQFINQSKHLSYLHRFPDVAGLIGLKLPGRTVSPRLTNHLVSCHAQTNPSQTGQREGLLVTLRAE